MSSEVPIRVTLVEDHPFVRSGIRALVDGETDIEIGGEYGAAGDFLEAVRNEAPDVAVLDVELPDMNGLDCLSTLLRIAPGTPVVILSMDGTGETATAALRRGAIGYVTKGSNPDRLLDAIRRAAKGERSVSDDVALALAEHIADPPPDAKLLSDRERAVLERIAEGARIGEIADEIGLSRNTVATYRSRGMDKLGVRSVPELVRYAMKHGLR